MNQMFGYCENITNIVMADEQDELMKARVAKQLKIYHLGAYINMDMINKIIEEAKQESTRQTVAASDEGEE